VPRRILLLITDLEIGGTPTVVRELATRLNSPPHVEIEVACLSMWGPVADQLCAAGISVTTFDARGPRDLLRTTRRLRDLVRGQKIDTVFSFLVHANVVAAMASRELPGVRFLQSIQTVQPRPRWHWLAQRWAHRYAERIVVPSNAIVRYASRRSSIPASKFVVVPNAIDPDAFPRVNVFAGPKVCAGYLGRLDPAKSPQTLVEALDVAAVTEAELHYFGDGPARATLEAAAAAREVRDRVVFHGAVPRPQDALREIDVLWMPSTVEGFGLVLIEAMASGVPVVAAAGGGVPDVVVDGHNGLIVRHPKEFAGTLTKLRADSILRNRLIEGGLRTVREKFTWDVVLPQYRELLGI
jgi:glycosyltransferase involved in cell wall biosynthesis